MKKIIYPLILSCCLCGICTLSSAQTNITLIIDNISSQKIDKIEAFDFSQYELLVPNVNDTIILNFTKKRADCFVVRFTSQNKTFHKQLWLDPGQVTVLAHLDKLNLVIDTVLNSPTYYKINSFQDAYQEILKKSNDANTNNFLINSFKENTDNPFSITIGIYYMMLNINSKENLQNLKALTDLQGDKFSWFITYPNLYDRLNTILSLDKLDLNKFEFLNSQNKKVNLSFKGSEFYVINFWHLRNRSSLQQHLTIKQKWDQLKDNHIDIIGVSIDQSYDQWSQYLTKTNLPWQNLLEPTKNLLTDYLKIDNFPTYMIFDKKAVLISTYFSFTDVLKHFNLDPK